VARKTSINIDFILECIDISENPTLTRDEETFQ